MHKTDEIRNSCTFLIDHVPSYLLAFAALQGKVSLAECAKFWGDAANRTDIREIIDVLSVTGGVPRYLEEIDPGLSAAENIRRMAFRGNGLLRTDFDEMFTDVVTRQPRLSAKALRALAGPPMGVSELADALTTLDALDGWESVMGYAFENLVVNNWPELVRPLHLGRALIESAAPWRRAKAKERLGPSRSSDPDAAGAVRRRNQAAAGDRAGGDRRSGGEGPPHSAPGGDVRQDGARLRRPSGPDCRGGRILRRHRPVPAVAGCVTSGCRNAAFAAIKKTLAPGERVARRDIRSIG